jgi:V/A-type H+-transporting ATPase subunit D
MERLALNKASLTRESRRLATFERFLPSLDLKRRQLLLERAKARRTLDRIEQALDPIDGMVAERIPMASNDLVDLTGLVQVEDMTLTYDNLVGLKLPALSSLHIEVREYGYLGRPHWVDDVARLLRQSVELQIRVQIARHRLALLETAVRRITQRVNLFEKVLIPRARENIRRLRIYLSDSERSAVVRGKIAKRKQLQRPAEARA